MRDALQKASESTGKYIFYAINNDGKDNVQSWGIDVANSWRT